MKKAQAIVTTMALNDHNHKGKIATTMTLGNHNMKGTQTIVVAMTLSNYDHEKNTNNNSSDRTKGPQS
jgi:hypothetical protein